MNRRLLRRFLRSGLATLLLSAMAAVAGAADPVAVSVTVNGIRSTKGALEVCLWSEAGEFPLCQQSVHALHRRVPVTGSSVVIRFEGVVPGNYAVAAHHDEDGDGRFGRNFFGMPTEGVGIPGSRRGMPDFRSAILSITAPTDLVIELRYLGGTGKGRQP